MDSSIDKFFHKYFAFLLTISVSQRGLSMYQWIFSIKVLHNKVLSSILKLVINYISILCNRVLGG